LTTEEEIQPYQTGTSFGLFPLAVAIGQRQNLTIIPEWLGLCTSNPVQLFTKILKIVPVTFGLSEKIIFVFVNSRLITKG